MKETLNLYRKLLRVEQWYKNVLIFIPLLFAHNALTATQLLLGFFGFCFISSITYITNDWLDREKDRLHPTKKNRPLASGKISGRQALIVAFILAAIVVLCMSILGTFYAAILGTYFILTTAYSFGLKNLPILDVLLICANFTLRMMAGLSAFPSTYQWAYFTLVFGLILMFLTHKRRSDIKLLGVARAAQHKPVLQYYTPPVCYALRFFAYVLLLFTFYQLFEEGWPLPGLAMMLLLLIYTSYLLIKEPQLALKPHYLLKKKSWDFALTLCILSFFLE